jgi:pimeloyl-ACP methyl ester carboxylesterase
MAQLTLDNIDLHYECLGEGEPLVLVHGLGANLAFWYLSVASSLAQNYRVILYDLRGHGESSAPRIGYTLPDMAQDLSNLLQALEISHTHLVGHSFGARVALYYALQHPDQIDSLTLADTQLSCVQPPMQLREWNYWKIWKQQLSEQSVELPSDDEWISLQLLSQLNRIAPNLAHGAQAKAARKPSLKRRTMGQKGAERWEQLLSSPQAQTELNDDRTITIPQLQGLTTPTFAFFGEYSHCLATGQELHKHIPNCQLEIAPEVGHFHPAVKPRQFAQTLQQFLQQSSPTLKIPTSEGIFL